VFTGISCGLFSKTFSVPTPIESEQPTLYSLDDALTLAVRTIQAEESKTLMPTTTLPVDLDAGSSSDIFCIHQVVLGETLTCIGRGYGVSPEAIAEANAIEPTTELQAGQLLQIPYVQWTNIPVGPVCSPQCTPPQYIIPDTALGPTEQPLSKEPSKKRSKDTDVPDEIWMFEYPCVSTTQQTTCP
jgi:LysM repeat protein